MSRYKAYAEYKDSGVELLEKIPLEWNATRIKFISTLNSSKAELRNLTPETEVTFLPMEAIGEQGLLDTSRTKRLGDVLDGYTYIGEGDVCIAKITPCFENGKGAVVTGLRNGIAFATTEVIPLRCHLKTDSKFLYYILTSAPFNKNAEGSMYGAGGQKRVSDNFVANYHVAMPPEAIRPKIAKFLDHETAKIDALIEKQQELIKLLKEKRQAVISHAVTKGLNPNAPMRHSGVEWLGEVPVHWKVSPIKWYASIKSGENLPVNEIESIKDENFFYPVYGGNGIWGYSKEFNLKNAAIIIGRVGALCGNVHAVKDLSWISDNALILNLNISVLSLDYIALCLGARDLNRLADKNAQPLITGTKVMNECVPIPPIDEQHQIEGRISAMMKQFEMLSIQAESGIALLQERRTALISAAVTGKIDVRDWQPSSTSTQPKAAA
ncbi:restriction endonuclease subunit S [Sapientia aquatica]|uniref:Restriction endonuclease subunit S n=1 Tax=Sapientia aquatica TaxID=1549640 RepID=A0A4V3AUU2_9BURK|nr:restriction endonuclease subunit S [Sapientia aquatica]TDK66440.1 restriction endonuclease subunit S [Sapientia aquatica]